MVKNGGHISAISLKKDYMPHHRQKVSVLRDVNLQIGRGETLAIVGASGVGKSTLLHVIGALDRPSSGQLYYDDLDIFSLDETALAQFRNRKVGFVFQFHHLMPEFNALENTMLPALIARMPRSQAEELARDILVQVGLEERILHKPGELSGGEQQRVAVARALIMKPDVLLADEPTGNLDEKTGEKIFELLLTLNEERGLTTVVVTHNRGLAVQMKRTVTIVDGAIEELA